MKPVRTFVSRLKPAIWLAAVTFGAAAFGQMPSKPAPDAAACPPFTGVRAAQLYGTWAVRFTHPPAGLPEVAVMQLQRHAEFSESLAGSVSRDFGTRAPKVGGHAVRAALAGDFEDNILILDESSNNVNITGTWNGEVVPGSCNTQFRGSWKDTSASAPADAPDVPFTLRKLP